MKSPIGIKGGGTFFVNMKFAVLFSVLVALVKAEQVVFPEIHQDIPVHFYPVGETHALYMESQPDLDPTSIAINFASSLGNFQFVVKNSYQTRHNNVHHVYLKQICNGLEVVNGDMNINIVDGKVVSYGSSFYEGEIPSSHMLFTAPETISPFTAVSKLAEYIGVSSDLSGVELTETSGSMLAVDSAVTIENVPFTTEPVSAKLAFIQTNGGQSLELVWNTLMPMEDNHLDSFVSARDGEILEIIDWVHNAPARNSYNVYDIGTNDPLDGERSIAYNGTFFEKNSPLGWHDTGKTTFQDTQGNNVRAQDNSSNRRDWESNYRPKGVVSRSSGSLGFDFPINFKDDPKVYRDAAITNLFYWNNLIHDLFYEYGFDEVSGNFQDNNFNKGGRENDGVIANAQDGSGTNNANFMTPPDGQRPRMRMYVWTQSRPRRDGDLDNGIIIHEYAHGISIRLTGGPSNVRCLGGGEAGGMGEGWGDFFGVLLRMRDSYDRFTQFAMGNYSMNNKRGVRKYVYTSDMKINPDTYASIKKPGYGGVHAKGQVWAVILLECYWNMIEKHGFDASWKLGSSGNSMMLQNVVDGLKIQPCRPNFVHARDAILEADDRNFEGANKCLIWKGFAKRGLGVNAVGGGTEDFTVPSECEEEEFHFTVFGRQ